MQRNAERTEQGEEVECEVVKSAKEGGRAGFNAEDAKGRGSPGVTFKLAGSSGGRSPGSTPETAATADLDSFAPVFFDFGCEGEGEGGGCGDLEFHAAVGAAGDLPGEGCAVEADGAFAFRAGGGEGCCGGGGGWGGHLWFLFESGSGWVKNDSGFREHPEAAWFAWGFRFLGVT